MTMKLEWRYHRPGCTSCKRAQEFLAQNGIEDGVVQSTGRDPIEGRAALAVLDGVTDLYVAKGQKILHRDLTTDRPSDDELLAMMLGRSGKLRAPTIRSDGRLIVGYNAEILGSVLT